MIHQCQHPLSARCNVNKSNEKATRATDTSHLPIFRFGENVQQVGHNARLQTHRTSNAKDKQHEEKQNSKQLEKSLATVILAQANSPTWGTNVNLEIASGYEINAKPLPPLLMTFPMSVSPTLWARFPRIPKIVKPPSKLVNVSSVVTIIASLNCTIESSVNIKQWSKLTSSQARLVLPINIMINSVITGKHDNRTHTDWQREEELSGCLIPNLLQNDKLFNFSFIENLVLYKWMS